MKIFTRSALVILVVSLSLLSCSKKSDNTPKTGALGKNFPDPVNNVLTPALLDSLKKHGVVVNDGLTPPTVNGIYLLHPDYCTFDNSGYDNAGTIFADVTFQFSNQNNTAATIRLDYKEPTGQSGSGISDTYISGSGNLFTIFASIGSTLNNINFKELYVVSGELQTGGIKNFQFALYLQSKDADPDNEIVKVGTTRIFMDQDGSSTTQTTFSLPTKQLQDLKASSKLLGSVEAGVAK